MREKGTQNTLEADALAGGQLSRLGTGSAEVETTVTSEAEADSTAARNLESNHPKAASEAAFVFELSYADAEAGTSEYVESNLSSCCAEAVLRSIILAMD